MNLLTQVREQFHSFGKPKAKAISHRPDLEGREHVYRQGAGQIVQAMDTYADYATVYSVYTWVQKAIAKIAENLAGLPVRVVDGADKAIEAHPLTELLANVNDEQTPLDLWSSYTINMMLGGESLYQLVPDSRGRPVEIWMRRPDRVAVVPDQSRLIYPTAMGYLYEPEEAMAQPLTIDAPWMVHDKFFNPLNPWRGLAPIHAVREGITIDMFAAGWSKSFLKNNSRPDYAIVAPQGITKTEKDDFEARFAMQHKGIENAHAPVLLEQGVTDIKVLSFPPKDIEWLQQREFSRDQVGAIFGVPDEIMGYGKDTYENFQTALEVFWTLTLIPLIRRRDGTLTHHFRRYFGLGQRERIATDLSSVGVLQEDLTPKVELARKFWEMGVPYNRLDEVLKLGVGAVEGGDIGYLPSGLVSVSMASQPAQPEPSEASSGQQPAASSQQPQILGYHIEQGVVSHNEARGVLGFPSRDESEDNSNRQLRTKLELMTLATNAGIDPEGAAKLVGLDVTIAPPPPPVLPPGAGDPPVDDGDDGDAADEPPAKVFVLPEGARDAAKRAAKKLIQQCQDAHLRALRAGDGWAHTHLEDGELRRWLGDDATTVVRAIEGAIRGIKGDHDAVNAAYNALKSDESISRLLEVAAPTFFRAGQAPPDSAGWGNYP